MADILRPSRHVRASGFCSTRCVFCSVAFPTPHGFATLGAARHLRWQRSTKEVMQMLKKLKVVLISAALVGGVAGIAAAQGGRDGGGFDHQARKAEMLQKFDA